MSGSTYHERRQILERHAVLGKLSPGEIDTLLRYSRVERYPEHEEIFAKGSPGTSMMLVLAGSVRISSISFSGKEIVFNIINAGELVGEVAVFDGGPRSGDAVAMTDCELLVLNRRDLMPCLERHADICLELIKILCERLRRTSEQVEDLVFRHVESRIAKALLQLHLSQTELSTIVGSTRESVNKQLSEWEKKGIVARRKELVIVRDATALERLI